MNYYLAKKIDKLSRSIVIMGFFWFLKIATDKIFGKKNTQDISTLYVVKLLGGGSLCILAPYLAELKKKHNIKIVLISTSVCTGFVERLKLFDSIIELDSIRGVLNFIKLIFQNLLNRAIKNKNAVSINFEFHSAVCAYITSILFAGRNCGIRNNFSDSFSIIYDRKIFYNGHANIGSAYHSLICNSLDVELTLPAQKNDSEIKKYINSLESELLVPDFNFEQNYLAVSPFSSGLSPERELTQRQIIEVINKQASAYEKMKIVILGSKADQLRAHALEKYIAHANDKYEVVSFCGLLNVYQSGMIARNSLTYITIDSGLNHYIRMTSANMIKSYWGPTDPKIMLDDNFYCGEEEVHYKKIFCSPCVHIVDKAPCGGNNRCLKELVVEVH